MPHNPEQPKTSAEPEQPSADQRRLLALFIASFEHSQGYQRVQTDIFRYLHGRYPDLKMTTENREWLISQATEVILHLLGVDAPDEVQPFPHVHVNEFAVLKTVAPVADQFARILDGMTITTPDTIVAELTNGMIDRDYRYLVEFRSRNARVGRVDRQPGTSRLSDPYFSYVCIYALKGCSTGLAELDALYRAVGGQCQQIFAERADKPFVSETTQRLEQVVAVHNRHHLITS